jgi:hypothetical protein
LPSQQPWQASLHVKYGVHRFSGRMAEPCWRCTYQRLVVVLLALFDSCSVKALWALISEAN